MLRWGPGIEAQTQCSHDDLIPSENAIDLRWCVGPASGRASYMVGWHEDIMFLAAR
jgi:hypothetical protein